MCAEIRKLGINKPYTIEILGYGEIYEIFSVNRLIKRLRKRYLTGTLYLCPNKDHSGRGFTLEELADHIGNYKEKGYVDSPPWSSKPRTSESKRKTSSFLTPLIWIISLFEVRNKNRAHMVYVFSSDD